jgi:K+-transporting ATPase A subunit
MSLQYEPCKFEDSPPRPLEQSRYCLERVALQREVSWRPDASSFVLFSFACVAPLFFIPRLQPLPPFNVGGWRPFRNITPLSNLIRTLTTVPLPITLARDFRRMVERIRHGRVLFWVMG